MDILDRINADKAAHVKIREAQTPLATLQKSIESASPPRGFIKKIRAQKSEPALIGEIKKASPSGGLIRPDFDPATLAATYESAGTACLSVLTDTPYFQGQDEYLAAARNACTLPALRKDFMIAPYQIHESRALGADCILLIMASLDDETARLLYDTSVKLGMDVLIEIHDREELDRALRLDPAPNSAMIGVNSRNLKTMKVDLETALVLADSIPDAIVRVAESGITNHADLTRLRNAGYNAFLVGESLMRHPDLKKAVRTLLSPLTSFSS